MSRWFRCYDDLVDDPKVQQLPAETFKSLINLWCLTSQNNGSLPPIAHIAFKLRMKADKVSKLLGMLRIAGLIEDEGSVTRPHNWNARQYKSDVTDPTAPLRQKAYRDRLKNRNASVTDTDTRAETEQITDTEKKTRSAGASERDENFEAFWAAYPRRNGDNPKAPSAKLFSGFVKAGADPQEIIDAAKKFAAAESKNIGTQFIPQTVKWLRNKRWLDFGPNGVSGNSASVFDIRSHLV
jgi:hypothetical protein